MVEKGKVKKDLLEQGVVVRTAIDIRQRATNFFPLLEVTPDTAAVYNPMSPSKERMETPVATSDHNVRTLRNKDGNYPKWMSKTKIDKLKSVVKKKKAVKKLGKKKSKL
jgi:hypothetical protein